MLRPRVSANNTGLNYGDSHPNSIKVTVPLTPIKVTVPLTLELR
jgi:hypothetical protein